MYRNRTEYKTNFTVDEINNETLQLEKHLILAQASLKENVYMGWCM